MLLSFEYYYGKEAEQYSFYRIPKALFTDTRFARLSVEAKVLYGLLLDRMSLSVRNNWLDKDGRVYIVFTVADMMATLGCAEQKTSRLLSELDNVKGVGLIERKRRGLGKPNIIYVKKFTHAEHPKPQDREVESQDSEIAKTTNQELPESQTNNTEINNTDSNKLNLSIHQEKDKERKSGTADAVSDKKQTVDKSDGMDKMDAYRRVIRKNISYDTLILNHPHQRESIDGFVELMTEVCCSTRETIRINQEEMDMEVVKSRLLKLDDGHIEYVMECLEQNTSLVGNIRAYTLSALYQTASAVASPRYVIPLLFQNFFVFSK